MKATLIKIVKITLSIIVIFYVINVAKNFYLYFTYEHGNAVYVRVEGQPDEIKGKWKVEFDSWGHGIDIRQNVDFNVNSDSTGTFYYKDYSTRITGKSSETYSWGAIFPFDKDACYEYQCKVLIDSLYIMYLTDSRGYLQDTLYSKYKISNDSLYIDSWVRHGRYTEKPSCLNSHSKKLAFFDLFIPYLY